MNDDRRLPNGYSNLGPIQIPPLPQAIVLTDRADGSLWMVSFNTSAPERLSITTDFATIQRIEGVRLYDKDSGPAMDEDGEFTLIIRSGRLGFLYNPFPRGQIGADGSPTYIRQAASRLLRQLNMSSINPALAKIGYNV